MNTLSLHPASSTRESLRLKIVESAAQYFIQYGYEKTTVLDIAKSIGISKSYIYKFFKSKKEIGETICQERLKLRYKSIENAVASTPNFSEKLEQLFTATINTGYELFFHERKLYDIASTASKENWKSAQQHEAQLKELLRTIIKEGIKTGEVEKKYSHDKIVSAIYLVLRPYIDPIQLQAGMAFSKEAKTLLVPLVLRSLAAQSISKCDH